MITGTATLGTANRRRKICQAEGVVQQRLLVAFVLLEVTLMVAGLACLHAALDAVVEENLYRVHFAGSEPLFALLLRETAFVLSGLLLLNVMALAAAEWVWTRHMNAIVRPLHGLLARTGRLDLSGDAGIDLCHPALALALAWRETERMCCLDIRAELACLDPDADYASPAVRREARAVLERLKASLPQEG